jgi:SAM-dependent methyltransferase
MFEDVLADRSAVEYADFVLPLIRETDLLVDVGCGPGSITVGLGRSVRRVTGLDVDDMEFAEAHRYCGEHGTRNVHFVAGSIYDLPFEDASFDVCTMFSMLETLADPLAGLAEVRRVVRPGGLVGASSIEYGGLILHGPRERLLRRFYELRLGIWHGQGDVAYHRGRELRGLLSTAGFVDVQAFMTYFSYGTPERVRKFGLGRAADCRDEWYLEGVRRYRLADREEFVELERAWTEWAYAPGAFAAFAWGRALARVP